MYETDNISNRKEIGRYYFKKYLPILFLVQHRVLNFSSKKFYIVQVDYGQEKPENDSRPILSNHVENMDEYDIVFLDYPNWLTYHNLIQCTQT